MTRRFLLDNDGSNFFLRTMTDDVAGSIAWEVEACPSAVTTYLLNPMCWAKFYYPSQVGEMIGETPETHRFLRAWAAGHDPFGLFVQTLLQAGKETFFTVRMNDVHDAERADHPGTSRFKQEHPEWTVEPDTVRADKRDVWFPFCLDYSHAPVRDYMRAILDEMAGRYPVHGLQMDWMRMPRHLSGGPDEAWAKRDLLTELVARVRQDLQRRGRGQKLAARVPPSLAGCRAMGIDLPTWCRRGLLDFVVLSGYIVPDYWMPVAEVRQALGGHGVPLYATVEFDSHNFQPHCPESLRANATGLWDSGADGLYIFNFPCWEVQLGARPYHWLEGLEDPQTACRKPLLFVAADTLHRRDQVDLPGVVPVDLTARERRDLALPLPPSALPARRAVCLLLCHGDARLHVNGTQAAELPYRRDQLFVEFCDHVEGPPERNRDLFRLFEVPPAALLAGTNQFSVENPEDRTLHVGRLSLGLW